MLFINFTLINMKFTQSVAFLFHIRDSFEHKTHFPAFVFSHALD